MPMDQTDKKLVNGAIVAAVLAGVVYFWPMDWWPISGYAALSQKEEDARETARKTAKEYERFHAPVHPGVLGEKSLEQVSSDADVRLISDLKNVYTQANTATNESIELKQAANKIKFPEWTRIPAGDRNPGAYFWDIYERRKVLVQDACRKANVELDDQQIGFKKFTGIVFDEPKSKELLRELHISEKIIELCIQAKQAEEQRERNLGIKPEAYMRIMQTEPQPSEPTGPTALTPNPKYDPLEKNPNSPKFKKYNIDKWPVFVQEYPVKIQLLCDTHSFITFLHSIRTVEGQFLVIRQLEILSPFLDESTRDKSELKEFKTDASSAAVTNKQKSWPPKNEQVIVTLIAAGMDFFDPKEFPTGIYNQKATTDKGPVRRPRRMMGTAPTVGGG